MEDELAEYLRMCDVKGWVFSLCGYDNYVKQKEQGIRVGGIINYNDLEKIRGGVK